MSKPITVTSVEELDATLASHEYTIIDFWATWCPPCKAIAPVYEKLASENTSADTLAFAKVDVDAQKQLAQRYNISAMPTFLLVQKGGEVKKAVRGADAKGIKTLIGYAKKKASGEAVSEDEEKAFSQVVFSGGGGMGLMPLLLLAAAVWYFFF
ncbi:thioredoxin-domain-containing protein [Massarina eburnea CBS 473.64]|uniref:Thioredoxin-domain-containing protein n=1 Tax=Massarina eburnea CBS 473.64 TaxID=1395130 RepID=A0A6A6RX22_9PLEO|nr:thioredoxin-domain-containing protein [Massarina eburnea CBS 473.64]